MLEVVKIPQNVSLTTNVVKFFRNLAEMMFGPCPTKLSMSGDTIRPPYIANKYISIKTSEFGRHVESSQNPLPIAFIARE